MNICVFGSASDLIDPSFLRAGEKLGEYLAREGHTLVFGGGTEGMMGAIARGFQKAKGYIIGIVPEFFKEDRYEALYLLCDETIYTEDISERLRRMEQRSDAYVVLPGGGGTYEEFFHVLVSKSLDRHNKPIAVYNINGYFAPLINLIEQSAMQQFISEHSKNNFRLFDETQQEAMLEYLRA